MDNLAAATVSTVDLSERGWPRIGPDLRNGQIPVSLSGDDQHSYNIKIDEWSGLSSFADYYYIWDGSQAGQSDYLYTEPAGAFQMGGGDDTVVNAGKISNGYFLLGDGDDLLAGQNGQAMSVYGGGGSDIIAGGNSDDYLSGDEADTFRIDFNHDPVSPSPGLLQLEPYDAANDGDDLIFGGKGNDTILGGNGDNKLEGGEGADTLTAGTGSDYLYGGPRGEGYLDILTGGGGSDAFILSYASDASAAGRGFWAGFFGEQASAVGGNITDNLLGNAFEKGIGEIAGAIAGPIGGAVVEGFVDFLEGLLSTPAPKPQTTDVMMVTDFDPSMDVLVLPLITEDKDGKDLTVDADFFAEFSDGSTNAWGLKFSDDGKEFAEIRLADDYVTSLGYSPTDSEAPLQDILNALKVAPAFIDPNNGSFSTMASPEILDLLPSGGFTPPSGAKIPSGATVDVFGAIGGQLTATDGEYSTIAGTQYSDALTVNPAFVDPATIRVGNLASNNSTVFGLGGGDVLYGGAFSDTLHGGDGDDTLYSFLDAEGEAPDENLSGGGGDDILYGGASGGTFDGGDGTDTFGVVYGNLLKNAFDQGPDGMQVVIDLTQGYAAERPVSEDPNPGTAPAATNPPFDDSVPNTYKLVSIENAIGGPLNDWIKAAEGSIVEGGAGPDYFDFGAGYVGLSYSTSTEGVQVNTSVQNPYARGGDAAGDWYANLGDGNESALTMLTGSGKADALYVLGNATAITGLGGSDVFGAVSNKVMRTSTNVTDFSQTDQDRIDLRPQGVTSFTPDGPDSLGLRFDDANAFYVSDGSDVLVAYELEGFTGTLGADDFLFAQAVEGTVTGGAEADGFAGGSGSDVINGRGGDDFLHGNAGDDVLKGEDGHDSLHGGDGDDALFGGADRDLIEGGDGADLIAGGAGADYIGGGTGDDTIDGGDGDDLADAGDGDDVAFGGAGDDILVGGIGDDTLLGGDGLDTAVFRGAFADYWVSGTDDSLTIVEDLAGEGGRDRLTSVELLQFDDGVLDLECGEFEQGAIATPAVETVAAGSGHMLDPEPLLTPLV